MKSLNTNVEVIVCGTSPFGLFTATLLSRSGVKVTLIAEDDDLDERLDLAMGVFWSSLNDPPTRAHVSHGLELAKYLLDFCKNGVLFFEKELIKDEKSLFQKLPLYRFGLQDFEEKELRKAARLNLGLRTTSERMVFQENRFTLDLNNSKKVVQTLKATWKNVTVIKGEVVSLNETSQGTTVKLADGTIVTSEQCVLASDHLIRVLYPASQQTLVPMSDVKSVFDIKSPLNKEFSFKAASGHFAGLARVKNGHSTLTVTGPKFLLPGAGVGQDFIQSPLPQFNFDKHIGFTQNAFKEISSLLRLGENPGDTLAHRESKVFVDSLPCDELPLVGEFGRMGRVFGCAGWLGCGNSAGAWGAKIMVDIITQGKSSDLHPALEPRRLNFRV